MRRLSMVLLLMCAVALLYSTEESFGWGINISNPSGLRAEHSLSANRSIAVSYAWDNRPTHDSRTRYATDIDYLWQTNLTSPNIQTIFLTRLYAGPGIRVSKVHDTRLSVRTPVGFAFRVKSTPVEVYFEFAPCAVFEDKLDVDASASVGVKFWLF